MCESEAAGLAGLTVLLIDDEESVCAAIEASLELLGVGEVVVANNGRTGLQLLYERLPSVVLLDLLMPDMDGFQVLRDIRARNRGWRPDRVVVLSALQDPDMVESLNRLGADAVLSKPFQLSQLRSVLLPPPEDSAGWR